MTPTPTDPREAVTADFCAQTNQELSREDLHKLMEQLQSTNSKLAAEIAELKAEIKKSWEEYESLEAETNDLARLVAETRIEKNALRAELEAARKERDEIKAVLFEKDAAYEQESPMLRPTKASVVSAFARLQTERDTALAAKDAALAGLRDIDRAIAGFFWTSDDGKTLRDAEPDESGAPQWFIETWKGLRILIAALTPAPTQEPPAGGVNYHTPGCEASHGRISQTDHVAKSKQWIEDHARTLGLSADVLMENAETWMEYEDHTVQHGSERWRDNFNSTEFWHHWEIVTGKTSAAKTPTAPPTPVALLLLCGVGCLMLRK